MIKINKNQVIIIKKILNNNAKESNIIMKSNKKKKIMINIKIQNYKYSDKNNNKINR